MASSRRGERAAWASIVKTHEALKGLEEDVQRTLRHPRDIRRSKEDDSMISSKVSVSSREVSLMISFPRSEKVAQYRLMKWKILLNTERHVAVSRQSPLRQNVTGD